MDVIEAAYAAATGEVAWELFADRLRSELGAQSASLWRGSESGVAELLYAPPALADWADAYTQHYHTTDVWTAAGVQLLRRARPGDAPVSHLSQEVVPLAEFRRSEFHADFARHIEMFHMVGSVGSLGAAGWLAIGCHRPEAAAAFGEGERRRLDEVLPHLKRALQLRHRLGAGEASLPAAALDAMPTGAVVVDAEQRIHHINASAERMAAQGGLRLTRNGAWTCLVAEHRTDAAALAERVRSVALRGDAGSAMALRRAAGTAPLVALVMPLPVGLAQLARPRSSGFALVLLRDPDRSPLPPVARLIEVFRLGPVEAAVALAAAGGATAETIAAERGVGVSTVRTQLRSVLIKTGAASLRDLTRLLAAVAG